MIRRLTAVTGVLMMLAGGVARAATALPQAADRGPGIVAVTDLFQTADASWMVHEHGNTYMYFGGAYRSIDVDKSHSYGYAGRTKCVVVTRKHFKVTVCVGSAPTHKIPDQTFAFDPALQSASVAFKKDGERNKVHWTGNAPPYPDAFPDAGTWGAVALADVSADARATGHVKGRDFTHPGGFSFLDEGAIAFVLVHKSDRGTIRFHFDGNRIVYRAVFRNRI